VIQRCSQRPINHHFTRDAIVSDAAARILEQAHFPSGHRVVCDCMADGSTVKAEDCKNLNVYDANGQAIARFATREFQARADDDGSITIFRRPNALKTSDAAGPLTLRGLNQIHAEFYKRGDL
jgi:hypothetical protein